jgi:hypothetical protein
MERSDLAPCAPDRSAQWELVYHKNQSEPERLTTYAYGIVAPDGSFLVRVRAEQPSDVSLAQQGLVRLFAHRRIAEEDLVEEDQEGRNFVVGQPLVLA